MDGRFSNHHATLLPNRVAMSTWYINDFPMLPLSTRTPTPRFDLYQIHGVTTAEDIDTILGPGGALAVFEEAWRVGKF